MAFNSRKTDPPERKPFSQLSSESESELTEYDVHSKHNNINDRRYSKSHTNRNSFNGNQRRKDFETKQVLGKLRAECQTAKQQCQFVEQERDAFKNLAAFLFAQLQATYKVLATASKELATRKERPIIHNIGIYNENATYHGAVNSGGSGLQGDDQQGGSQSDSESFMDVDGLD